MKIIIHTISREDFDLLRSCIGQRLKSVERPDSDSVTCDSAVVEFEDESK